MNSKLGKLLMTYALIGAMSDNSMSDFRKEPKKKIKEPTSKKCPLCDLVHYGNSRYCCEEHRVEYKRTQKLKKKGRTKKN